MKSLMSEQSKIYYALYFLMVATGANAQESPSSTPPMGIEVAEEAIAAQLVSVGTDRRQSEKTAPAVTSVVTARQIREMGARDLFDVLRTIPGFFLGQTAFGIDSMISVRGFTSSFNQTLLVMLDGVPQNDILFGNRFSALGNIPLDMIERIEVMRGPGSALYGADAYSAAINILTYRIPPTDSKATVAVGSNRTRDARLFGGGRRGAIRWVGGIEYSETDGDEPYVRADSQTVLDGLFGTHASLAPGWGNTHQQRMGGLFNLTIDALELMLRFSQNRRMGMLTGAAGALDPIGHTDTSLLEGSARWGIQGKDWLINATLTGGSLSYQLHNVSYFPDDAFGGLFPDGVRANEKSRQNRVRFQGKTEYSGWAGHTVSAGLGIEYSQFDLQHESRNYFIEDGLIVPLGTFRDITEPALLSFNQSAYSNDLQFVYVQDEWAIWRDWILTWGVRYDDYSDFGTILSPRIGLVWNVNSDLTLKGLYGRGFRGSSLLDREAQNVPTVTGNSHLRPEKLDSFEWILDYRPRTDVVARLNLFYQQTTDQIRLQNSGGYEYRPENVGQQKGHGLELEGRWAISPQTELYGSYAYQKNTDETTGADAGYSPHHLALIQFKHQTGPWLFSLQGRYVGGRDRLAEDPLPRAATYGFVDALVRYPLSPGLEIGMNVRNLFDKRVEDARAGTGFPIDLPLSGRTVYFSLTQAF